MDNKGELEGNSYKLVEILRLRDTTVMFLEQEHKSGRSVGQSVREIKSCLLQKGVMRQKIIIYHVFVNYTQKII